MSTGHRARRVSVTVVLTLLFAPLCVVFGAGTGTASVDGPFKVVGTVPQATPAKDSQSQYTIVAVDAPRRLMFQIYPDTGHRAILATYDISHKIPKLKYPPVKLSDDFTPYSASTAYTVAYDSKRQQLAFVLPMLQADQAEQSQNRAGVTIVVYSNVARRLVAHWSVNTLLPGFSAMGITYSAEDDRYYLVGELSGNPLVADGTAWGGGSKAGGVASGALALSADQGKLQWWRPLSNVECPQIMISKGIGSLVARSRAYDALYFVCDNGGTTAGQTYPTETTLVRLYVTRTGTTADEAQQRVEYFPISGSFYSGGSGSGIAAYDAVTDRFFLQSISFATPGTWVFDGRLSSWVGFVSSPNRAAFYMGVNPTLGHLYIGTNDGGGTANPTNGLLVADVHQTPVPAGEVQSIVPTALILTDAGSNRLFVRPGKANDPYLVIEDTTPATPIDRGVSNFADYDLDTSGTPDTPKYDTNWAISANGFAAESVQVGGIGAPLTAVGSNPPDIPGVAPGTRALMSAHGSADLRPAGAAAGAQAIVADLNTTSEYDSHDPNRDGPTNDDWPYPAKACLDSNDTRQEISFSDSGPSKPANGGKFTIVCDLAKNTSTVTVEMGATGSGATTVGHSTYRITTSRDTKQGGYVTTDAIAAGVTFDVAGGYSVQLARAESKTTNVAHGMAGTATSAWQRVIEGLRVFGPDGSVMATLPGCESHRNVAADGKVDAADTCGPVAKQVNALLPTRVHVQFPMPVSVTTPKGAFSGVEQTAEQYYQATTVDDQGVIYRGDSVGVRPIPAMVAEVYTDTAERSRTVTVLAATQSNANFTSNPPFDPGACCDTGGFTPPPLPGPQPIVNPGVTHVGGSVPPPATTAAQPTYAAPATELRGFLFMRRAFRDVVLLVLLSGLVLGGAGTALRRRRLVDVLVTVPGREAL